MTACFNEEILCIGTVEAILPMGADISLTEKDDRIQAITNTEKGLQILKDLCYEGLCEEA